MDRLQQLRMEILCIMIRETIVCGLLGATCMTIMGIMSDGNKMVFTMIPIIE